VALGLFVALTLILASLAAIEYSRALSPSTITSLSFSTKTSTETTTVTTSMVYTTSLISVSTVTLKAANTTTSTSCTATGGIGCPHFLNNTYTIRVNYTGPWGLTYHSYLGMGAPPDGTLLQSGEFFGHGPSSELVNVAGTSTIGTAVCVEAQKLDATNTTLTLSIASATNQTSIAYGSTTVCIAEVIE